jgi:hypothetical protein
LHPEPLGGARDVPFFGDGYHITKLPEFHALPGK